MDESSRDVAERAAGVLAPESDLFEDLDSAGFGEALTTALQSSLANPTAPARATLQWWTDLARIPMVATTAWFGREIESPVPVDPKDRRFSDPAWSTTPFAPSAAPVRREAASDASDFFTISASSDAQLSR